MPVQRHQVEPRSPTWHLLRAEDLTASDLGAAFGVDKFKTPLKLYAEKAGLSMPQGDNPMMRRGRWLESAVVAALEEEHPDWLVKYPLGQYLRDPDLRLGATPDAWASTDEPGITSLQLKVVSRPVFERDWADGPPLAYELQTLCEGMLAEADRSLLVALVIDTYSADLQYFPVPRHAAMEERIRAKAVEFWKNVEAGVMPAVNYDQDAETVSEMFSRPVPGPVLDLDGDNELAVLLPHRAVLKEMIAIDQKKLDAMDTEIKAKLGSAEEATCQDWKLSWKEQTRKQVVIPEKTFRVLRVTELKEKAA